jgi:hypothetical protein
MKLVIRGTRRSGKPEADPGRVKGFPLTRRSTFVGLGGFVD